MKYLSSSRIHLFNQCGLSYNFKYLQVTGLKDETVDWFANYGTLMHTVLERIARKEIPLLDMAYREFDAGFPTCNVPDDQKPTYYTQGRDSITRKFQELSTLRILGVEVEFTFHIAFGIPPIHGFIDLVYEDEKGRLIVRDYKTSKVYGKSELDRQYQQFIYSIACKHLYGRYPFKFEYDFIRFDEQKDFIITERFVKLGELKMKAAWNRMKSGPYEPNYNPFFCEHFCESKSICPIYLKKKGY